MPQHTSEGRRLVGVWRRSGGWRVWLRWWSFQDGPAVVGSCEWPGVGVIGSGSRFGQVVGDRWRLRAVGPAQRAEPGEITRLGLVKSPPAEVFEPVIVATKRPGVDLVGSSAVPVINGVVQVGAAGAGAAAGIDTRPVPNLNMAAQRCPGESSGRVLSGR